MHSIGTVLLKRINTLVNLEEGHVTGLVPLDLFMAFDTAVYDIVLHRYHSYFGLEGMVLKWTSSYLTFTVGNVNIFGSDEISLAYDEPSRLF